MTKAQILKKIAYLEFVQDQLSAELIEINQLLKSIGFPQGLESAKIIAREMLQHQDETN